MKKKTKQNPLGAGRPPTPENFDYATYYAEQVVAGEIVASNKNIQVAQRHLDDLQNGVEGYEWKPEEAAKIIKFVEMLPDPKTGKGMKLELYQIFILASLTGWLDKDGYRRFKKAYISMARKNGKTLLVNGLAVFELLMGKYPEHGKEIYITARTHRQAQTMFKMAHRQLSLLQKASPSLRKDVELRKTDIVHLPSDSLMMPLANSPDSVDSKNPSFSILEEYASVDDTEMYNRLSSGMTLQRNGLLTLISTASNNLNSPMYSEYLFISKLLNKEIDNDAYFIYCAEMDSEKEIEDESLWIKANPLLSNKSHHKTILKNIKRDINEQRELGEEQGVLIKNFNMWQATNESSYISPDSWQAASTDEPIDITGTDTIVGLDLSSVDDLTAVSFAHMLDSKKIYVDSHAFVSTRMPIDLKMKRDKTDYIKLEQEGYVTISRTKSGLIDYGEVIDFLLAYEKKNQLNIKEIVYDPAFMRVFLQVIEYKNTYENANIKWTFVEQSQQMYKLSPIIKQFRIDVWNKKVVHSNNPILNIAVNNAVAKEELNNNIRVSKKNRSSKIDPLAALFNAHASAMFMEFKPKSASEKIDEGDFGFIII